MEEKEEKTHLQINASKGGEARALSLTAEERSESARKAVQARWAKAKAKGETTTIAKSHKKSVKKKTSQHVLPVAKYKGFLDIMDLQIPCYVLDDGQRLIGRVATTEMLSGFKGQGDLEGYLRSQNLQPYINKDEVVARMVSFSLPEVEQLGRDVKGLPTDLLIDVCRGLVAAMEASQKEPPEVKLTTRQIYMAVKASMFLVSCAKVGLDALVDEATGYQEHREKDALQVKLRAYLATEMRKWERTFPDELWIEFGRLTNWKGSVTHRPKYWGHLVTQLIYEYLDADVAHWLKENVPNPRKGQNYHQWLSSQYGLKKLIEHIWMVVGISRTCYNMDELKSKMKQMFGKGTVQLELFMQIPAQAKSIEQSNQPKTQAQIDAEKAELEA
jgi:hypothetical protein